LVDRQCIRALKVLTILEVLTIGSNLEVLPVFSFREEAEMLLRLGGSETDCRVRESTYGELTSVLYASCRDVRRVALDPLSGMVVESKVGFASPSREAFIEVLLPSHSMPTAVEEPHITGVAS
jgi:hypothetical protein